MADFYFMEEFWYDILYDVFMNINYIKGSVGKI